MFLLEHIIRGVLDRQPLFSLIVACFLTIILFPYLELTKIILVFGKYIFSKYYSRLKLFKPLKQSAQCLEHMLPRFALYFLFNSIAVLYFVCFRIQS